MATLKCPKCKSHNITLLANDINTKTVSKTNLNLNPLSPNIFKTTTVQKEKLSAGKIFLAIFTFGGSLFYTGGIRKRKRNEYLCQDCGKRWTGK
jgi:hypothetical protein